MAEVGRLEILLEAKIDRLQASLDRARGDVARTSRDMERQLAQQRASFERAGAEVGRWAGRVSAGASLALAAIIAYSVRAASNAEETANAFQVAFGRQTEAANRFAQAYSQQVGRALVEVQGNMARTQLVLTGVGVEANTALAATEAIAQRAVDLGSLWNVDDAEAYRAVISGISGEAEPLKRFGVSLTQAALSAELLRLGFRGNAQDAPEAAKAIARLNIILRQTQVAQGDATNTADSLANRQRRLRAEFENSAAEFGQQFLPIANQVLHWATDALRAFNDLPSGVQAAGLAMLALVAAAGPIAGLIRGFQAIIRFAGLARAAIAGIGAVGGAAGAAEGAGAAAAAGGGAAALGGAGAFAAGVAVPAVVGIGLATAAQMSANRAAETARNRSTASLSDLQAAARYYRANPGRGGANLGVARALDAEAARRILAPAGGAGNPVTEPPAGGFALPPELQRPTAGSGNGSGRGRGGASGPSASELENRRALLDLENQLAVAREASDAKATQALQDQLDTLRMVDSFERAGLDHAAAQAAAQEQINAQRAARAQHAEREAESEANILEREILEDIEGQNIEDMAERIANWGRQQVEQQLVLARLAGDSARVRELERQLELLDRIAQYEGQGLTSDQAKAQASGELSDEAAARVQGGIRQAVRSGLDAAVRGGWPGLVEYMANALRERMLDRLADVITNLITASTAGGTGKGGGTGSAIMQIGAAILHAIPGFANGTASAPGGLAYVHKDELINLPAGSQVIPSHALRAAANMQPTTGGNAVAVVNEFHLHAEGAVMTDQLLATMEARARNVAAGQVQLAGALERRRGAQRSARVLRSPA